MTHRTTQQMFGKIARDIAAHERAVAQDAADRAQYAAEAEARLDEPLTRREVLDALENVTGEFGTSDARNMLLALMEALK